MRATPSQRWVDEILLRIVRFRRGRALTLRSFQALPGMLTAASSVIPLGLLSLRPLKIWMNRLGLHPKHHRDKLVTVTTSCLRGLQPWKKRSFLTLSRVHSFSQRSGNDRRIPGRMGGYVAVQNCPRRMGPLAGGTTHECVGATGSRSCSQAFFLPVLAGRHVLIRTDNMSVVWSVSLASLRLIQQLLSWAYSQLLSLRTMQIPGTQNVTPEFLSRQHPDPWEWRLNVEVVQAI